MRIGLLEISHWHFPLYADALQEADIDVVAVSDADMTLAEQVAGGFMARAFDDPLALIEHVPLDFAFVFGRHDQMPVIAAALIERAIPFALEKPGALNAADVGGLRVAAEARGLYVAVPFVQRVGPVAQVVNRLIDDEAARFSHSAWRFFGGPPSRYPRAGNGWMLDRRKSGGGCLINLAPHFLDFALQLHGPGEVASAQLSAAQHQSGVEDIATVSLAFASGDTALVQSGYCFPDHPQKREYSFSLVGTNHYVRSTASGLAIYRTGNTGIETIDCDLDADPLYGGFVRQVLADLRTGGPPVAGLADLEAVMGLVDTAYRLGTTTN